MLDSYSLFWRFRAHEAVGYENALLCFGIARPPQQREVCPSGFSVGVSDMSVIVIIIISMASSGGVTMEGDIMRHAEYTPKSTRKSETEIDKRLVSNEALESPDHLYCFTMTWLSLCHKSFFCVLIHILTLMLTSETQSNH